MDNFYPVSIPKLRLAWTVGQGLGGFWEWYGWESREECEKYMKWVNRNRFLTHQTVSAWTAHGGKEPSFENPLYGKDDY